MKSLFTVVDTKQEKEILNMLPDFRTTNLGGDHKFPLLIRFDEKIICRFSSITVLAELSRAGHILKDFDKTKQLSKNI